MNINDIHRYFQEFEIEHWGGDSEGQHTIYYDPKIPTRKMTFLKDDSILIKPEIILLSCLMFQIPTPYEIEEVLKK